MFRSPKYSLICLNGDHLIPSASFLSLWGTKNFENQKRLVQLYFLYISFCHLQNPQRSHDLFQKSVLPLLWIHRFHSHGSNHLTQQKEAVWVGWFILVVCLVLASFFKFCPIFYLCCLCTWAFLNKNSYTAPIT